jgi:hypothetical protein
MRKLATFTLTAIAITQSPTLSHSRSTTEMSTCTSCKRQDFFRRLFRKLLCEHDWGYTGILKHEQGNPIDIPEMSRTTCGRVCNCCGKEETWSY